MAPRSWAWRLATTLVACQFLISSVTAQVASFATVSGSSSATPTASQPSSSASPSASSGPKVYLVKAGSGGFKFTPQSISDVAVGDIITFEFYPRDHSVARAEYGSACVPYEYTGKNKVGFWSTTQWVDSVAEITHWNLTINSTEPIFFYCAAPNSCKGEGMVGVINPNGTQTLDTQIRSAKSADFQLAPGEAVPKEATSTLVNAATSSPSTATSPPATNTGGSQSHGHGLSGGAIAGIVVGAVAFLVLCAALFFFVGRSKSLKEVLDRQDATARTSTTPGVGGTGPEMGQQYGHHPGQHAYSPTPGQNEYSGMGSPPMYGQHSATEQYPSGWASPPQQHGHFSGGSVGGLTQQQIDEIKAAQAQAHPVELHSPPPNQQEFTAELEAHGQKK